MEMVSFHETRTPFYHLPMTRGFSLYFHLLAKGSCIKKMAPRSVLKTLLPLEVRRPLLITRYHLFTGLIA